MGVNGQHDFSEQILRGRRLGTCEIQLDEWSAAETGAVPGNGRIGEPGVGVAETLEGATMHARRVPAATDGADSYAARRRDRRGEDDAAIETQALGGRDGWIVVRYAGEEAFVARGMRPPGGRSCPFSQAPERHRHLIVRAHVPDERDCHGSEALDATGMVRPASGRSSQLGSPTVFARRHPELGPEGAAERLGRGEARFATDGRDGPL